MRELLLFKRDGDRLDVLLLQSTDLCRRFEILLKPGVQITVREMADSAGLKNWLRSLARRGK